MPDRCSAPVATLRDQFRQSKRELCDEFAHGPASARSVIKLLRTLARHVDRTLIQLWEGSHLPSGAALLAVGGYGRGELFPQSDVDVLILLPNEQDRNNDAFRGAVEGFVTACWDVGLEIGSSVRTVEECLSLSLTDVTVQTSLLECRLLYGSQSLYTAFRGVWWPTMKPEAFFRAKTLEMHQRHQKHEDTPYALEPNCKESPGGLRDLQVVSWVAKAAGLGGTWKELAEGGLLTSFEAQQLQRNETLLKLIRARLHVVAGRREDRLLFDLQTAVAESFGYHGTADRRASEALMRRYYWAAKGVSQLNQILMLNIEERVHGRELVPLRAIDGQFHDRAGLLEVASDDLYERDRHAILRTFLVYQRTPGIKGLSARTLRALYNARTLMDASFRSAPANRIVFMEMLCQPQGQTHVFRLLNATSVLGRYLWTFRRIVGQMQHDLFHVYTVDQHILMVLRNVRRFFIPEHAHEYPYCSQLAADWAKPHLLYIAALYHDIAKGRGGDHSELGSMEVRRFCRVHGINQDDTRMVDFLVREHLTLSRVAQKEDLSDPEVIKAFARRVRTEEQLTGLYLLTVADIRGTSPKVWNAWKGKLLEDLYRATLRALGGHVPNRAALGAARKQEALNMLNLHAVPTGAHEALWATLDVSYFARHEPADIAWHTRHLSEQVEPAKPVVRARLSSVGEGLQVFVYTADRPDVFARSCGYFDGAGFSILDAKIHTTRKGYVLDTYQVALPSDDMRYRDILSLVEHQLAEAVASKGPLPEPSKGRLSRRVKSFPLPARVALRPDEKAQRWLLTVSASDRNGLLYAIARVLARHKLNLQLAKITTLGERVEDTFLVDGPALQHNRTQLQIESELLDALAA